MSISNFCDLENFLKNCGFSNNFCTLPGVPHGCNDIPGGFQDLDPQLFIIIGEILGNVVAGSIPFNVQNALGNWLQLVGQSILTYNAQQQYFQGGPGRYFDIRNKNVSNPFCPDPNTGEVTPDTTEGKSSSGKTNKVVDSAGNIKGPSTNIQNVSNQNNQNTPTDKDIADLKNSILLLTKEVNKLKSQINKIK